MRDFSESRGGRTIGLALAAAIVVSEAALVAGTGAFGIPGVLLVRFSDERAVVHTVPGGETVVSKLAEAARTLRPQPLQAAPEPKGEPSLVGLADKIPWPQPEQEQQQEEGQAAEPKPKLKAFAENSLAQADVLPWDAAEPFVPEGTADASAPATDAAPQAEEAPPQVAAAAAGPRAALPEAREIETWLKGKATQFNSEDRSRGRLFHFELWLEPPAVMKERLAAVAYAFDTPAILPQAQVSTEQKTGFRVVFGGLACAEKVLVTLKFKDGQSQEVALDGCRLLTDRA